MTALIEWKNSLHEQKWNHLFPTSWVLEEPKEPSTTFLGGPVLLLGLIDWFRPWFQPFLPPFDDTYKMLSFHFGLTYKAHFLRDDRTGQKPTFLFSEHFCRSPPGGAVAFVYVLGFWPFWGPLKCDFQLFLAPFQSWDKNLQNITFVGRNVFPNSFYSQNRILKYWTWSVFPFWPFLKVSASIFSTFSGPIQILAQKSTK